MKTRFLVFLAALVCTVEMVHAQGGESAALKRADALFKSQNWAEARTAYDAARDQQPDWHGANMRRAVEGAVACSVNLVQWDEVTRRAEDYIAHTPDSLEEAVGQRLLGDLLLLMPHYGTVQGDHFLRGQTGAQSQSKDLSREDRQESVRRLERARELLIRLDADPARTDADRRQLRQEWIGTDFDLSSALVRSTDKRISRDDVNWWLGIAPLTGPDEDTPASDDTVAEQARRYDTYLRNFEEPPPGLPRGPDGKPLFVVMPSAYAPTLDPGAKVLFVLAEVERLDTSAHHDDAARAVFRRAMLARLFYGPGVYAEWFAWWEGDHNTRAPKPARPPTPATKTWQLGDDQTLTVVGSHPEVVDLPPENSPLALLSAVEARYPESAAVPEARFARGLYFQSRQQFPQALAEYRAFLEKTPTHPSAEEVRAQIKAIEQPDLQLGDTGVHLAGERPKLAFTARNAGRVEFSARPFDLLRYAEDPDPQHRGKRRLFAHLDQYIFQDNAWKKYLGHDPVVWSEVLPSGQDCRAVEGSTLAPLTNPGAYIVEARVAGKKDPDLLLVLVTDSLLVRKTLVHGEDFSTLILACDARTGRPLANRAVRVYEDGYEPDAADGKRGKDYLEQSTLITDANGAVVYTRKHHNQSSVEAVMVGDGGQLAFSAFGNEIDFGRDDPPKDRDQLVGYLITDRPVYRPGATAHFCVWLRRKHDGAYRPPSPESIKVEITNPSNRKVQTVTVQTDATGVGSWDWTVDAAASLGVYEVSVGEPDDRWEIYNRVFRVEEYRQPEFEVNVHPSTAQARLGEKFSAAIEARYYFGAPVTQGKVSYQVYREVFDPAYFEPGPYDWLYGKGYGLVFYTYPWLSWWPAWGSLIGWGGDHPSQPAGNYGNSPGWNPRVLVAQGEADLGTDGKYTLEVDTARAKAEDGNHDHQYTIEATVRGLSRRAVEGRGSVVATRQEFYAYVETDHGWYAASNETRVQIRTLTPGNVPVAAHGEVVISRVRYQGPNHDEPVEEEEKRWDAETGPDGRLAFTYPLPGEGQYHVSFRTHDSWQQEVQGNTVFWVNGPKFDGRVYRFNELEIITDRRSYHVGETAHLLVNTAADDARVLFADRTTGFGLGRYRFLDVPGRSLVVDVPIDESCVPNMFVEATTVRQGRVHTESCNLVVPPERGSIHLSVRTDKPAYEPGAKGSVHVEATDAEGKPASGEVALTVFDKAVTYIAPEGDYAPVPSFYGYPDASHEVSVDSSFDQEFNAEDRSGDHLHPENVDEDGKTPEGWSTDWQLAVGLPDTRLPHAIRALEFTAETAPVERVVVTGSNIPTSEEVAAPRPGAGADGADAVLGKSAAPSASVLPPSLAHPRAVDLSAKLADAVVRTRFSDTALWLPALRLDDKGAADAEITFPQGLTTWRVHGYAINAQTQVGEAATQAVTTRQLIVRLLSPRFFTERDEVVLSAAINNYLPDAQDVTAELVLPAGQFQWTGDPANPPAAPDADGNLHLTAQANVAPNTEHRFDWPVRALRPGLATVTARVLAGPESDGARLAFPVEVHGIEKTLVQSGSFGLAEEGERGLHLDVPAEADPEKTRLEISLSPSLAGVMIDALPYLADYPYGCVEQTVSRFYPSVLVRDTLKRLGTDLETVGNQRRQMNPADLDSRFGDSPVYDSARLERMIHDGLASLYNSQRDDGGWGWWGEDDESSIFQTAYVLQGLQAAKAAGVAVDDWPYQHGYRYLRGIVKEELAKPRRKQQLGGDQSQVYLAYILSLEPAAADDDGREGRWLDRLYTERGSLNNYGRALLTLALHHSHRDPQAQNTLRNLLQFVQRDDSNGTARVRTPSEGWWFWWNNGIETNAWALKALVALDPHNDLAPRLVKWLLNNRRGGSYWHSTRDTAQVISAMTDYLLASGEGAPDSTLSVSVDGQTAREVHITRDNLFSFDDKVRREGLQLPPGPHEVVVKKGGSGALYYACRLTYFTHEEDVKSAASEIVVERTYAKLVSKAVPVALPPAPGTPDGPARVETFAGYNRVPLQEGDEVVSGDQIEVTLKITAKNTYDYLAFEDHKPAGCEPVEVRSGEKFADGFCANVELRDTKTVFFVRLLEPGEHLLRYRLRAETPGRFHVLPATGAAMYAPEVRANSDEMRLNVRD